VEAATPGYLGLTSSEVADRVSRGLTNVDTDVKTQSVGQILAKHTLTLFNAVNLGLAALVLTTGEVRNLMFVGAVLFNLVIGVFQEIRAKRLVDRLAILTQKLVRVRRDGEVVELSPRDLVLDDLLLLAHGEQVPADAEVVAGEARLDESLLTGESLTVPKARGDRLLSGSFVDSGSVWARVTTVGMEGYAARINAEAKYVKPVRSEIRSTVDGIIRVGTAALIPLGALLLVSTIAQGSPWADSVLSTVAAVVGMIPQGLVLLTSTVFAIATTRLAHREVLVQQPYCVEALARVDTICLDKTGTITTGAMEVLGVVAVEDAQTGPRPIDDDARRATAEEGVVEALSTIAHANADDANDTSRALMAYADKIGVRARASARAVPFSSATKRSGCVTADGHAYVMGAGQFVLGERFGAYEGIARSFDPLARVLVVAEVDGFDEVGRIRGAMRPLGFVAIRDQVRDTAARTVGYFEEQGVELFVISGDDPATVSAIAGRVGIADAERFVDAQTLATSDDLARALEDKRVFGRVTPQQKREIVRTLHAGGRTVAMTGDGVNDVLALKEADCSVAMASGSAAARNIAEIVLADNDFAHMPEVVAEGRRSINNLQRSASLFLSKTAYSAVLALLCIVLPPYPFIPIQMTLLNAAVIGAPSFVLALEPNHDRVRGNFLANVLARSLPASLAVTLGLTAALVVMRPLGFAESEVQTACMCLTAVVGLALVVRVSLPMTRLRAALVVSMAALLAAAFTLQRNFFRMAAFTPALLLVVVVLAVVALVAFTIAYNASLRDIGEGGRLVRLAERVEEFHDKSKRDGRGGPRGEDAA